VAARSSGRPRSSRISGDCPAWPAPAGLSAHAPGLAGPAASDRTLARGAPGSGARGHGRSARRFRGECGPVAAPAGHVEFPHQFPISTPVTMALHRCVGSRSPGCATSTTARSAPSLRPRSCVRNLPRSAHPPRRALARRGYPGFSPSLRTPALRAHWGAANGEIVLLHVGRMAAEKNYPLLFCAYDAMRAVNPHLRFVLVGDGPLRPALQAAHPDAALPDSFRAKRSPVTMPQPMSTCTRA